MSVATWYTGDALTVLKTLPDASVDLVLTSPPFLALRSYLPANDPNKALEIGSEATPGEFLDVLLDVVVELRRVLAPHGSLVVELGDTYSGSGGAGGDYLNAGMRDGQPAFDGSAARNRAQSRDYDGGASDRHDFAKPGTRSRLASGDGWPLAKSLCMVPSSFAFALAYGRNPWTGRTLEPWRVRNLIAWCRPNPPVGALGDKFRPGTSYLTVACTGASRFFDLDAVREPLSDSPGNRYPQRVTERDVASKENPGANRKGGNVRTQTIDMRNSAGAPPLDWWEIPTHPYPGAHYATFPPQLCVRPIKAMCPQRVCRVCGKPSVRVIDAPTELRDRHPEFAAALRDGREAKRLTQRDVDRHFGLNGMCSHWERRINGPQSQPAYPTPEQWGTLQALLDLDGEFTALVEGFRRWKDRELDPDYRAALERTREDGFYASTGNDGMARSGVNGPSTISQHRTLGWSDCGHNDWRNGVVLDPFAGSGTTLEVATGHGRDAIGIDLDPRNLELARQRIGLFLSEAEVRGA